MWHLNYYTVSSGKCEAYTAHFLPSLLSLDQLYRQQYPFLVLGGTAAEHWAKELFYKQSWITNVLEMGIFAITLTDNNGGYHFRKSAITQVLTERD